MSLFNELKRRNVIRVAMAYVVASWLIIQVVETILPAFGYSDVAIRYIVIILAILFIPILVFSWAFEVTPEGLKREVDVVREHSITRFTGKKLDRIIMVLLALALGYFAFDKFVLDPVEDVQIAESAHQEGRSEAFTESFGDKSIAVLPFVNMSDDASNEYFSDGISEELLNLLSRIPELRVISRSSAFSFKGKDFDIPTIATQLNVAHILEGSVRKDGNRVRITAQLIEARSDNHLWSESYDRELSDIFAVQDEISAAITRALKERLGFKVETAPRVTAAAITEAHDAYLRGRYLVVQRTTATIEGAVREFEKAIALDPDYAHAHAELAIAIALLTLDNYGDLALNEVISRATHHAERSMALDPKLAAAQAATGFLFHNQSEYEEALTHYEQAIQLNPSYSIVYTWMGNVFNRLGLYEEEFSVKETALKLNPLSNVAHYNYTLELMIRNRLDEVERQLEKMALLHPVWCSDLRGEVSSVNGKWANMALGSLDALMIDPESFIKIDLPAEFAIIGLEQEALIFSETMQPQTMHILGRTGDIVSIAEARFSEDPTLLWPRRDLGIALAAAGEFDRARTFLEEMWQRRRGRVVHVGLFEVSHAAALISIRRDNGEEAEVGELLTSITDNVRRYHEASITGGNFWNFSADYEEGLAAYLAGEHEQGLKLIARAAEEGFFILPNEAYLQTLYDDPDFAPIMADQQVRQSRERNRFLAIVCTDNRYEAVWQPAEGTCERFAEESGD
jgi:TolB-like protein/Tfp pilus assembly protein PilF